MSLCRKFDTHRISEETVFHFSVSGGVSSIMQLPTETGDLLFCT